MITLKTLFTAGLFTFIFAYSAHATATPQTPNLKTTAHEVDSNDANRNSASTETSEYSDWNRS